MKLESTQFAVLPDGGAPATVGLNEFQRESVQMFAHAARALALPKSLGQIYGLLYATPEALHLDEVVSGLQISKGSASQGLRWLRELGAVKLILLPGDRRDRFVAETELRQLATGFLRNTVEPHLGSGDGYLDRLQQVGSAMPGSDHPEFYRGRVEKLHRWNRFAHRVLPVVLKIAEKF